MKMWSGRFRDPLDKDFERWQRSFPFDRRLLPQEIAASCAYAHALGKAGVLAVDEVEALEHTLERIEDAAQADADVEDVHDFVERKLVELAGEIGYKLHAGRSRNEQIATDLRLFTRDAIDAMGGALVDLLSSFIAQAEAAGASAMPAYTHMQRAEPVLI